MTVLRRKYISQTNSFKIVETMFFAMATIGVMALCTISFGNCVKIDDESVISHNPDEEFKKAIFENKHWDCPFRKDETGK